MKNHLRLKYLPVFSAILIIAQLLSACTPATPEEKVTLRLGWMGFPDTINPASATLGEAYAVFDLVYVPLLREAPDGKYVGGLAKTWEVSADGLVWTFTLNDNIKWHDGSRFTADDMAWSINAIMDNPDGWASFSAYAAGFTEVIALNNQTLQITLSEPVGNMEYRVSFLYPVFREHFEPLANPDDLLAFENLDLIGNGPFKLELYDGSAGLIVLAANPDYFAGRPIIDQVSFQTYDDVDVMVRALQGSELDAILDLPQSQFSTIEQLPDIQAVSEPGRYFTDLIINSTPADHDPAPNRNPALEDPQVRLAMAQAINKQALVDVVLEGLGAPGVTIVPPILGGGFWYNSDIQDVPFDLEAAKQTLEAAGYTLASDGVRTNGELRLEFRLQFPDDDPNYQRIADLVSTWFQSIGIKANIQPTNSDDLIVAMTPTGDFDLVLWGWG
jgi:peptide/nickel transport system substrate-binding protein